MPCTSRTMRCTLFALCIVILPLLARSQDYSANGPYSSTSASQPFQLPASTGCGKHCKLTVQLTVPVAPASAAGTAVRGPPYPLVAFFNGFQSRAAYYTPYAARLASWGVAVLQYDTPLLAMPDIATELKYLPVLLADLKATRSGAAAASSSSSSWAQLAAQVDTGRLATAGHSRGGKLAALFYAGLVPGVRGVVTSVLVDPVDNTVFTPEGPKNPSATKALAGRNKTAALIGAGVVGSCNPADAGYRTFWPVLGRGSWQQVVWGAGHAEFAAIPPPFSWVADKVCGAGKNTTQQEVIALTAAPMAAWIDTAFNKQARKQPVAAAARASPASAGLQLPGCAPTATAPAGTRMAMQQRGAGCPKVAPASSSSVKQLASLRSFFAWVAAQEQQGLLGFQVKA